MTLDPNRLRKARLHKKLSRAELAERSKISERQIIRLESESASSGNVRE
jgi:transcriptional regulator with XRE-family HTH domain